MSIFRPCQELLSEAFQEERERSEAAVKRAAERTQELVQGRMEDLNRVCSGRYVCRRKIRDQQILPS